MELSVGVRWTKGKAEGRMGETHRGGGVTKMERRTALSVAVGHTTVRHRPVVQGSSFYRYILITGRSEASWFLAALLLYKIYHGVLRQVDFLHLLFVLVAPMLFENACVLLLCAYT